MLSSSKHTFYLGLLLFITGLFYSCAQIGSISGGLKDTIQPIMIYSQPVFADTAFSEKKVVLTFDEYFVIKGINEEFISSPPLKEFPEIKTKKRSLVVKIEDTLVKPATYVFYFGNAIADLNESNVLENFRFVFSTGSEVDSFSIAGSLKKAFDLQIPEKALVMVYQNSGDSIPYLSRPDYLSKIDSSGNFSIDFIREGKYKIFALQDLNGNLMFDKKENLAFLDSLIIPKREITINIDSVKAGTILHDIDNPEYADSLVNDTIIITEDHKTKPNNIFLYMFAEKQFKQRLSDNSRPLKGKLNLTFDIPISEKYQLKPLNFSISDNDYLLELNEEKDSLLYWYKDTVVQAIDTLKFELKFASVDSLDNAIIETDTVFFEFREKKDAYAGNKKKEKADTIKKVEYLNFNYKLDKNKLDLKQNLSFELETPPIKLDTSLIKLYEIRDTSTVDTKEQKIVRAVRTSENQIFIEFARPIINMLDFNILGLEKQNWYSKSQIDSTTFNFIITDVELAGSDTLNLIANFDNLFFLGQIQQLTDTLELGLTQQSLKAKKRKKDNIIELGFAKPLSNSVELFATNFPNVKNAFSLKKNMLGDSLKITINNNNIRLVDTLLISLKSLDYLNLSGDSVFYTDTITLIYREKGQYLSSAERYKKNNFKLIFNKKVTGNINIEPQSFTVNNKWFNLEKNETNDTLSYEIIDDFISEMDTLDFVVKYSDEDRKGQVKNFADTLMLIIRKKIDFKEKIQDSPNKRKKPEAKLVNYYVPLKYELLNDSSLLRVYHVVADWQEKTKYRITADSMAFIGYFNHFNKKNQYEFSTHEMDYYAQLNINITNLVPNFNAVDTLQADTLRIGLTDSLSLNKVDSAIIEKPSQFLIDNAHKIIGKANFILQLLDEKGRLIKEYQLKEDEDMKIDYLPPGKCTLKIIFDKNANGKWDTGNYLKKLQAERVLIYPKILEIKEGWEINIDWDVGKQLIKSMQEGD